MNNVKHGPIFRQVIIVDMKIFSQYESFLIPVSCEKLNLSLPLDHNYKVAQVAQRLHRSWSDCTEVAVVVQRLQRSLLKHILLLQHTNRLGQTAKYTLSSLQTLLRSCTEVALRLDRGCTEAVKGV